MDFLLSPYVTFTILFGSMGVFGGYLVGVLVSGRKMKKLRATLSTELASAHYARDKLKRQMSLVKEHSQEYFHTLLFADFPELEYITNTVDHAVEVAEDMRNDGNLIGALRVACWIIDPNSPEPMDHRFTKEQRDVMSRWQERSKELLTHIADELARSLADNRDSGIQRRRVDRRPTDLDLKRLREGLLLD